MKNHVNQSKRHKILAIGGLKMDTCSHAVSDSIKGPKPLITDDLELTYVALKVMDKYL